MAMPEPQVEWTLEMVHALPDDGNRYELLDGELLVSRSPSFAHQRVLQCLYDRVRPYTQALGDCDTLIAPAAVTFSLRRELQPDLLVLPIVGGHKAEKFADVGRLLLAVEVVSPSTTRNDRYRKRPAFQQEGVPETWIVDPSSRMVERWRPADDVPEVLLDQLEWRPSAGREPLVIALAALFREALDG